MSKKPTKPDEFTVMAQLFEILKPFDASERGRLFDIVDESLERVKPKPRKQRSDAGKAKSGKAAGLVGERLTVEY